MTAHVEHGVVQQLLTPQTLAAMLGLAVQTIYNRHSTGGDLPRVTKLGRLLRFRPTDVEVWLEGQQENIVQQSTAALSMLARRPGRPTKAEQIARRKLSSSGLKVNS